MRYCYSLCRTSYNTSVSQMCAFVCCIAPFNASTLKRVRYICENRKENRWKWWIQCLQYHAHTHITHSTYVHLLLLDVHNTRAAFLNHPNHYQWHTVYRLMHCCHDLGQVKQQIATKMPTQVRIQHQIVYQHLLEREREKCNGNMNFFLNGMKFNETQWNEWVCVGGCVMCFKFFFDIQIIWIWWWWFFPIHCVVHRNDVCVCACFFFDFLISYEC